MGNFIAVLVGLLVAAGFYSFATLTCGYKPYDFNQTTWVGEFFLVIWHVLGACAGVQIRNAE